MKIKNSTLYFIVIIIAFVTIFINIRAIINCKKTKAGLTKLCNIQGGKIQSLMYNDSLRINLTKPNIDKKLKLWDEKANEIVFEQLVNTPKLIYKFSSLSCNSCVENEIRLLKNFASKIGEENIILISNFSDIKYMYNFKRINELNRFQIYNLKDNYIHSELSETNIPYYFIVENDFITKALFLPNESLNELTVRYYNLIIIRYFN